jgi:hypothetical protein
MKVWGNRLCILIATGMLLPGMVQSQPQAEQTTATGPTTSADEVMSYEAGFFSRYQPRNALDMVRQVPGFLLDDGEDNRGFGAAAGNVLINGRRPSAKQNTPSAFLTRISAGQVERIELIRNQVRGIDMLGHSALVNIILYGDMPARVRYETSLRHNNRGPIKPTVDISLTDRWGDIDYTAGFYSEREANGETGDRILYDDMGNVVETSDTGQKSTGIEVVGTLSGSTWIGESLINANGKISSDSRNPRQHIEISPQSLPGGLRQEFIEDELVIKGMEVGTDVVRNLNEDLLGKAIFLLYMEKIPKTSTRRLVNTSGIETLLRIADTDTDTTEGIARLEFNWSGMEGHAIQLNMESAYNEVDGSLLQTDNRGTGPTVINVPGANSRVDEVRWDLQLKDNWSLGSLEFDYGLGAEFSTISQTGDSEQERSFRFLKPIASVIWSAGQGQRLRFTLEREVAQLNFNDFISATVFEDDDIVLGNPDLHPDATWVTSLGYEKRYGKIGVFKVTAYHHWIDDVLDLLPLTATNAVPGNIGNGRRWGVDFENSIPLEWLGLTGSKLSFTARWQDSTVVDPVTGDNRVLSGQGGNTAYRSLMTGNRNMHYFLRLDFRQDLESSKVAWGWTAAERDTRLLFKVDELDTYDEDVAVDAFVETTRRWGVKLRVLGENLLDFKEWRDRTVFEGERDLSPIDFRETRNRYNGRKITLSVSGSF